MTVDMLIRILDQFPKELEVVDDYYLDVEGVKLVEVKGQKMLMIE